MRNDMGKTPNLKQFNSVSSYMLKINEWKCLDKQMDK